MSCGSGLHRCCRDVSNTERAAACGVGEGGGGGGHGRRYGKKERGDELPQELRRAEARLKRICQAKVELEAGARAARQAQQGGSACSPSRDFLVGTDQLRQQRLGGRRGWASCRSRRTPELGPTGLSAGRRSQRGFDALGDSLEPDLDGPVASRV